MFFVETKYTLATEEAERIGVDHVARLSSTGTLDGSTGQEKVTKNTPVHLTGTLNLVVCFAALLGFFSCSYYSDADSMPNVLVLQTCDNPCFYISTLAIRALYPIFSPLALNYLPQYFTGRKLPKLESYNMYLRM